MLLGGSEEVGTQDTGVVQASAQTYGRQYLRHARSKDNF
jgi:hypothetical protein